MSASLYVLLYVQYTTSFSKPALRLARYGEVRALQRKSQFLLGERVMIVCLNRVTLAAQTLVRSIAKIACLWGVLQRSRARERVAFV